jgi:TP901 family phage tail tape measure protein
MSIRINVGASFDARDLQRAQRELEALEKQLGTLSQRLKKTGDAFSSAGRKFTSVGRDLTKYVTLPIVGLGAAALKSSIDFESAFADVTKTVTGTTSQLEALERGIRDMSQEIPASAEAIAGVAAAAGQLGIETDAILGFSRVMIDLGNTTNLSADEAATALARLANITGMSARDYDRLGSSIVDLGNNLATTEAEIVQLSLRLGAAGSQIGLSVDQTLAFAGALTSMGVEAEAGGTNLSKAFTAINSAVISGGKELDQFARISQMSAEEFSAAFREDPADAIVAFVDGLRAIRDGGGDVAAALRDSGLSGERMARVFLGLVQSGDLLTDALNIGNRAWNENTALQDEAAQRYETTASRLSILWNQVQETARIIGDELKPILIDILETAVVPFLERVRGIAEAFARLDRDKQRTILAFVGIAAAAGAVSIAIGAVAIAIGFITAHPIIAGISLIAAVLVAAAGAAYYFREELVRLAGRTLDLVYRKFQAFVNPLADIINVMLFITDPFGNVPRAQKLPDLPILELFDVLADRAGEFSIGDIIDNVMGEMSDATQQLTDDGLNYRLEWGKVTDTALDFNNVLSGTDAGGSGSGGGTIGSVVTLSEAMRENLRFVNQVATDTRRMGMAVALGGDLIGQFARDMLTAGQITEDTGREIDQLANSVRQRLNAALEEGNRRLDDAQKSLDRYADSIARGVAGGNMLSDASRSQQEAVENLARAQERYNDAVASEDEERISDAAQDLADAKRQQGTFLDFLQFGATTAEEFAKQIDQLRLAGASMDLLQEIAQMGVETGSRIASELLAGGAAAIEETNRLMASVDAAAESVGESAAQQFFGAGVAAAEAFIDGIESVVPQLQLLLDQISFMFEKLFPDAKRPDVTIVPEGQFVMRPGRGSVDEQLLASRDLEAIGDRVADVFINRGVGIAAGGETEEQRIQRITGEIARGERSFDDLRRSVDLIAARPVEQLMSSAYANATNISVNVSGAIDPEATARTIIKTLDDAQRRTGVRIGL